MRTFKLLLPIITNIVLILIYLPFSLEFGTDYINHPDRSHPTVGSGFYAVTYFALLLCITTFWIIRNAKKYLTFDVDGRYIALGVGLTGFLNGGLSLLFYVACLDWYIPWLIYKIFEIYI